MLPNRRLGAVAFLVALIAAATGAAEDLLGAIGGVGHRAGGGGGRIRDGLAARSQLRAASGRGWKLSGRDRPSSASAVRWRARRNRRQDRVDVEAAALRRLPRAPGDLRRPLVMQADDGDRSQLPRARHCATGSGALTAPAVAAIGRKATERPREERP